MPQTLVVGNRRANHPAVSVGLTARIFALTPRMDPRSVQFRGEPPAECIYGYAADGSITSADVNVTGTPVSRRINCSTLAPIDGTEWHTRPLGGVLAYDEGTATYLYGWRTRTAWGHGALRCREFRIKLADNSIHGAIFKFQPASLH